MDALAELREALPEPVVLTDADVLETYRFDFSRDPSAGTPMAVVRAQGVEQVQTTVRWAARHGIPVVPRGAGSGVSGGSCERSCAHAKNRTNARRRCVAWSRIVPRSWG